MIDDANNIEELRRIAPDLAPSVAKLRVPAYVLDRTATVRWMNAAAIAHFGDLRGRAIREVVASEYLTLAKAEFAAKLLGTVEATEARVVLRSADGKSIPVDISSTQLGLRPKPKRLAPRPRHRRRAKRPPPTPSKEAGSTPGSTEPGVFSFARHDSTVVAWSVSVLWH